MSVTNAAATEVTTLENGLRVASEGAHGEVRGVPLWWSCCCCRRARSPCTAQLTIL